MFDWPLDWIALLIAIGALVFARKAAGEAARLRARLDRLEAGAGAEATTLVAVPPPLTPAQEPEASLEAEESAALPPDQPEIASTSAAAGPGETSDEARHLPPPLPSAAPQPAAQGFEERIGTRWVVWIGGLALALGGFFLVRYSIEAGLVGPAVRVTLGGLFALALLGSGEWARRKESLSQIAPLPIANIPAILTAAGTAVAFATVYAAYALYDFLAPATAFMLLGIVALGTLATALLHGPALAGLGIAGAFVTPVLVSSDEPNYWALYI